MPATPPGPGWAEIAFARLRRVWNARAIDLTSLNTSRGFLSGDEMRRLLTRPLSAPRTGFHDARIIPVGDPQSVMELYGSDDGFLRDSGRTRRGPPKALRASDVLGDDTRPFGAFDAADTRSERGPMARAETPGAPILKIDPQDRKKVKGVKAGARARTRPRRARPSLKFFQILPSPPRACLEQSRAKSAFFPALSTFLPHQRNPGTLSLHRSVS